MVWLVLSYVVAAGLALGLGIWLGSGTRVASRRRHALRWAFESASSEADRARRQEAEARIQLMAARQAEARARAELEVAHAREAAARNEAEDSKALAAMIEAEMVAARWEKEEIEQRARTAHAQLEERARGVAALHAALVDAVRRAERDDERRRVRPIDLEPARPIAAAAGPVAAPGRPAPTSPGLADAARAIGT
jgi:chromosome segregation ATPase